MRGKPRWGPDADMAVDALPDSVVSRVSTLIQEGALRRACAALLQDPPVSPSGEVVSSLRALHPSPPADERVNLGRLRRVSPSAAPVADVDQVRKAVHSIPSTSGAGRSGLRPSHLRDAMRASSDLILRLIAEVVNLLNQSGSLSQTPEKRGTILLEDRPIKRVSVEQAGKNRTLLPIRCRDQA